MKTLFKTIGGNLWLLSISLVIIVTAGIFITGHYQKKYAEQLDSRLAETLLSDIKLCQEGVKDFFLYDVRDERYYSSGLSKSFDKYKGSLSNAQRKILELLSSPMALNSTNSDIFNECKLIEAKISTSEKLFTSITEKVKERGFYESGISGALRKQGLELQEKAEKSNNPLLTNLTEKLRFREAEYKIHKTTDEMTELLSIVETINNVLSNQGNSGIRVAIGEEAKLELYEKFQKYAITAKELAAYDKEIGDHKSQGLSAELVEALKQAEAHSVLLTGIIKATNQQNLASHKRVVLIVLFVLGLLLVVVLFFINISVRGKLGKLTHYVKQIGQGKLPEGFENGNPDEISKSLGTVHSFMQGLKSKVQFIGEIGNGKYNSKLELSSKYDTVGLALKEMQANLQKTEADNQARKANEEKHNWITKGLAKFGDILRQNNENINKLSDEIIGNLVKYLDANQGGLFLINDDNQENVHLEMISSYAYDRKKFKEKEVSLKEGLLGTCAVEKQTIFLKEIPEDYVEITSGLGEATPKCLLLVPLLFNQEILGVIELASFTEFEKHQIDFVEQLAGNIASTLASVKVNTRTSLLLEQTQKQADELATQEEEIRQNLEEMQATQEEMQRKQHEVEEANRKMAKNEEELKKTLALAEEREKELQEKSQQIATSEEELRQNLEEMKATQEELERRDIENQKMQEALAKEKALLDAMLSNIPDSVYFKDRESRFIRISKSMVSLFSANNETEIIGKSDFDFQDETHARQAFNDEQEIIRTGDPIIDKLEKEEWEDGRYSWISSTKMPLKDLEGNIIGTFGISRDITEIKNAEINVKEKAEQLAASEEELRQNLEEMQATQEELERMHTEQQEIQDELEEEKALLEALLHNMPDSIYFKDLNSKFLRVSEAMAKRFGTDKPDEMYGKSDFDFFTAEHAQPAFNDEQRIIKTGVPLVNLIEKETFEDGRVAYVSTTKMPLRDINGNVIGTFGISRDVTEAKEAELLAITQKEELLEREKELQQNIEELKTTQNHLESVNQENEKITKTLNLEKDLIDNLLDNVPEFIYFKDIEGKYMKASLSLIQRFGLKELSDITGKTDYDFFEKNFADKILKREKTIIQTGKPVLNKKEEEVLSDGSKIKVSITQIPLKNAKGEIFGIIGISKQERG